MNRTLIAIAAIIACSTAMPADAAKKAKPKAAPCTSAANVEALNVRALQTELMVGALACGERERYNAFIQARQPELVPYAVDSPSPSPPAHGLMARPGSRPGASWSPARSAARLGSVGYCEVR